METTLNLTDAAGASSLEGGAMAMVWRYLGVALIAAFLAVSVWAESSGHIPAQVFHEMGRSQ